MAQNVRRDRPIETCHSDSSRKSLTHGANRLAIPFDHPTLRNSESFPAPQVRQQAIGEPHGWLPLLSLTCALHTPIEDTPLEIHMPAPDGWHQRSTANRRVAGAGVQPEQDEAGHVPANRALGALIAHNLPRPPCRPDQPRRLRSREPALACDPLLGSYHRHNLRAQPLAAVVIDGST